MSIEEEHMDVLQNIEFAIVGIYRQEPSLLDYDVQNALQALARRYEAEQSGRPPPTRRLNEKAQQVYEAVEVFCELRLGRHSYTGDGESAAEEAPVVEKKGWLERLRGGGIIGKEQEPDPMPEAEALDVESLSLAVMVACLKRILTSIRRWTKEGGRQGYLQFVSGFIL